MSQRGQKESFAATLAPSPTLSPGPASHSLLHDEGKAVLALKGVVELDQVHMAELVHDVNLILDILLVKPTGRGVSKKWVRKSSQLHLPRHTHSHTHTHTPCILISCSITRFPQLTTHTSSLQQKGPAHFPDRNPETSKTTLEIWEDPVPQGAR